MMPRAWQRRLGVLLVVFAAHWIAFGTLPFNLHHSVGGLPGRGVTATTVSIHIGPAPTPISAQVRARPVINKLTAQPNKPDAQANENPAPQTPDPDGDGLYGISGMLDDDRPIVLSAPKPTRLQYDCRGEINGHAYSSAGELLWRHDETRYEARMDVMDLAVGLRTQTSNGQLTERGLEPLRFEDKTLGEFAALFDHAAGKARIGPDAADADLTPGAQDPLSVFIQLAAVFAGSADRLPAGSTLAFQTIGALSSQRWVFTVVGPELLVLPTGAIHAIHLTREPGADQDGMLDLWHLKQTISHCAFASHTATAILWSKSGVLRRVRKAL
jgi:hypothetical protein